ncbi:DUF3606 domain-containing protein [Pedobacter sp. GR22-6]|uniref:DUF3606 domain-containing protein n=1 Tax=Pedobacter sp. GR22-6 TaxID=3127957 RepID=UPI00307E7D48
MNIPENLPEEKDEIDVNSALDLVLLAEQLFVSPRLILRAIKIVGNSRKKVIAHLVYQKLMPARRARL